MNIYLAVEQARFVGFILMLNMLAVVTGAVLIGFLNVWNKK